MGHAIIKVMSFSVDVWNTIENRGVNSDMETQHIIHNFEPIYNEHSKILMLGTMPSPKSREVGFYYGHPRNRFWKVVSDVCGEAYPETREGKIAFALRNGIAVWDVLAGCDIKGADDSSIRNPQPNDLSQILEQLFEAYSEIKKYI